MSVAKKSKNNKDYAKIVAPDLVSAISKLKAASAELKRSFVESVDIAVNLGIDPKQSDQSVKGSLVLPKGSGKKVRVLVFSSDESVRKIALEAGAKYAGMEELIQKIENGFIDFDCCIATPDVMQKISKVAKKLGPRGLMPSPKNGTVTNDVPKAVKEALNGRVDFKNDKSGIVHCIVGKVNFDDSSLLENIQAVLKSIKDSKPESSKGKFIKSFYINTTMGPSVEVATDSL